MRVDSLPLAAVDRYELRARLGVGQITRGYEASRILSGLRQAKLHWASGIKRLLGTGMVPAVSSRFNFTPWKSNQRKTLLGSESATPVDTLHHSAPSHSALRNAPCAWESESKIMALCEPLQQQQPCLHHSNNALAIAFGQRHGTTTIKRCQELTYCILRLVVARQQRQQRQPSPAARSLSLKTVPLLRTWPKLSPEAAHFPTAWP